MNSNIIEGERFFQAVKIGAWAEIDKRKQEMPNPPAGYFILRGLVHDYLVKIRNSKKMGGNSIYYETYVTACLPAENEHIGERHNVALRRNDNRQVIKILAH